MKSPIAGLMKNTVARSFSAAPVSDFGKVRSDGSPSFTDKLAY